MKVTICAIKFINLYTSLTIKSITCKFLKHININIMLQSNTKIADKNIACKLVKYTQKSLQSVNIILHKYDCYS